MANVLRNCELIKTWNAQHDSNIMKDFIVCIPLNESDTRDFGIAENPRTIYFNLNEQTTLYLPSLIISLVCN